MLRTIYKYRNLDHTRDMNDRYRDLIRRGIFQGGSVVPVLGQLKVDVTPFKLVSNDGLVVIETADTARLNVTAGQTNVVSFKVRYIDNDNVQTEWSVLEEATFNSLTDKDYHVIFSKVTLDSGATQVLADDISLIERDVLDTISRSLFRGRVDNSSALPAKDNRLGDYYIVGITGVTPSIYVWNGDTWNDVTTAVSISSLLTQHRQNLFSNEKHLTDSQQAAAQGSAGVPSVTNKYVTEADYRLPTVSIRDALNGSDGAPNAANKFITQAFPFAIPTEISYSVPPMAQVEILPTFGPFYVGTGTLGTATQWFNIYDSTLDAEFVNSDNTPVYIVGIYTDSGLSNELNPSTNPNVDALGYFSGSSLYVAFDIKPDKTFRLNYGRRKTFKTADTNFLLLRGPKSAQADWRIFVNQEAFNREISPLQVTANNANTTMHIKSAVAERLDGTKLVYTLPDATHSLNMAATNVNVATGTISGTASGTFMLPPSMGPNWYVNVGFAVRPNGDTDKLDVVFGLPAADIVDTTIPFWNSDTVPFAEALLKDDGTGGVGNFIPVQQSNVTQYLNPFLVTKVYDEEIEITTSSSAFFVYPNNGNFPIGSKQCLVMVNGAAKSVEAGDYVEVTSSSIMFNYDVQYGSHVRFRSSYAIPVSSQGAGAGYGITWATPVDANIIPDTHLLYDLGRIDRKFKDAYIGGKLTVDGLIDPIGIEFKSSTINPLTAAGFWVESTGGTIRAVDNNSNNIAITTNDGHINTEANIQKNGVSIRTDVQTINFVGPGVSVLNAGLKKVEVQISGGGGGSGSAAVYSYGINDGGAEEVYKTAIGPEMHFKTLSAGNNIVLTPDSDVINIGTVSGLVDSGVTTGVGSEVFKQKSGTTLQFRSLVAGTGVTLTQATDSITITSSGGGGGGVGNVDGGHAAEIYAAGMSMDGGNA